MSELVKRVMDVQIQRKVEGPPGLGAALVACGGDPKACRSGVRVKVKVTKF